MAEQRFYPGWALRAEELAEYLATTYRGDGYDTQLLRMQGDATGWVLQVRERYEEDWQQTLSTFAGLDTAATVTLKLEGEGLALTVGGGKWLDKAAVAGVAAVASAGLLFLPAGIGAWKQSRLLTEILTQVETFVRINSQRKGAETG